MLRAIAGVFVIAYLPGALIFRLPAGDRTRRFSLPAEERAFWAVIISVGVTTMVALALTSTGVYTLGRLVVGDLVLAGVAAAMIAMRRRGAPAGTRAPKPTRLALMPVALVVLGLFLFFPPAEYLMGGKDPGTYINEGIQIAQHGSWTIPDTTLALLPADSRGLFVSPDAESINQGTNFMGFFVLDFDRGTVVGQFPHAYPVWIAIGYGLGGVTGARSAIGFWGLLGVLAVYFASARLVGRLPAFAGTILLAINVADVWFARYPNSELMQQALLFAGMLALVRAVGDEDALFGAVAGVLLGVQLFARIDTLLLLMAIGGGILLLVADGKRPRWSFWLPLAILTGLAGLYYVGPMKYYASTPLAFLHGPAGVLAATAGLTAMGFGIHFAARRWPVGVLWCRRWLPRVLAVAVVMAFAYGYFWRVPHETIRDYAAGVTLRQGLAANDAYSLKHYAWYVGAAGLFAAVLGLAVVTWRSFWRDPVMLTVVMSLSWFFFYKTRIVPEHFWLARRYLPVILPMTCVLAATGALLGVQMWWERRAAARPGAHRRLWPAICYAIAGTTFIGWLGWQYATATIAIAGHVEYAGLAAQLDTLSRRFGDRDLVLVESRNSSDAHVLAAPLAYIYGRHVLQVLSPRPDRAAFDRFCQWAIGTFDRVYFVADGGTDITPSGITITPVASQSFEIPEYESALNAYPRGIRQKKFSLSVFQLSRSDEPAVKTDIDVGTLDDVWVLRFYAKEHEGDVNFRWVRNMSFVSLMGIAPDSRAVTLRMSSGGRPPRAGAARVQVYLNDHLLGDVEVADGFHDYTVPITPAIADEAARKPGASVLRLMSTTWSPKQILGGPDDRQLGVMLDRVRVERNR
ncbi:MAG: hypothetical protein NT151_01250 [Acidobacteria bacterium]|nr:hypothetical protein [Acidobacteriota bacterium]